MFDFVSNRIVQWVKTVKSIYVKSIYQDNMFCDNFAGEKGKESEKYSPSFYLTFHFESSLLKFVEIQIFSISFWLSKQSSFFIVRFFSRSVKSLDTNRYRIQTSIEQPRT